MGTVMLILLAAQALGAGAVRLLRWSPEDWRERILYQTAVGLGSLSYLSPRVPEPAMEADLASAHEWG